MKAFIGWDIPKQGKLQWVKKCNTEQRVHTLKLRSRLDVSKDQEENFEENYLELEVHIILQSTC